MGFWENEVSVNIREWLLRSIHPSVRYLTLRDLVDVSAEDQELKKAQAESHQNGKINEILSQMHPDGYWVEPGAGYYGKYRSSVWSLITLAQLGANVEGDARIAKACTYYLAQALTENGQFTISGTASTTMDCLQGNMCAALLDLGYEDERLDKAFEWMARSVTGDGIAPMGTKGAMFRYYSGKIGPDFQCGANNKLPCAWGAVKVMLAFGKLPVEKHTPLIKHAIDRGIKFLFSVDPASAQYPCGYASKPSSNWWKFGFPVFYVTDILQLAEALTSLGYGKDPRLSNTLALIREKQDVEGHWMLEYDYKGKTWNDFGEKQQPNPWVTIRALKVLKNLES